MKVKDNDSEPKNQMYFANIKKKKTTSAIDHVASPH